MAATTRINRYTGAGPSAIDVSGGIKFTRDDSNVGTTSIPIPPSGGGAATNYSYYATIALFVTVNTGSVISNKRIYYTGSMPTGMQLFSQTTSAGPASNTYTQCAAPVGAIASAVTTAPSGYDIMTTSTAGVAYDTTSATISSNNVIAGYYCRVVLGCDQTATTTGTVTLPTIYILYDEA